MPDAPTISSCFDKRIGISGCGVDITDAAFLINDLPGISIENIDAMSNDEEETFVEVWDKILLRGYRKFELSLKAALAKCYRITDSAVVACLICAKKESFDVALWYLLGTELMIERTSSDEVNRWTTIDLDKAERLKGEFYAEFQSALDDAIKTINPEDSDCIEGECIECVEAIHTVYVLP